MSRPHRSLVAVRHATFREQRTSLCGIPICPRAPAYLLDVRWHGAGPYTYRRCLRHARAFLASIHAEYRAAEVA